MVFMNIMALVSTEVSLANNLSPSYKTHSEVETQGTLQI